ncbi:MAG: 23S rRNA (guanosine(2251)-2'-O)-methyltransferase RlmB [Clostridia bacterium]|nr:23S rRNA (guanosine(2251)-2'-O)-methyltransferase RlmB [Clostridia bacterium]
MSRQDHLRKDAKAWDKEDRRAQKKNGTGEHNRFNKDDRFNRDERAPRKDSRFEERRSAPAASFKPAAPRPQKPAFEQPSFNAEPENLISGRNPIREAIKAGRDIEKILVAKGDLSATAREIVQMAREAHIPVQTVERTRLDEITRNHQGMLAFASAYRYYDVEDMLEEARTKGQQPFLIVLDSVTDPQNLGAIIRTAACVGAHGVIVPQRRAVGLTPSAVKASAGAIERIKVARVGNLSRTLEMLKNEGIWLYAADMSGEDYRKTDFSGAVALVIGSEGEGVSRLTMENCDFRVKLPMTGVVDSLNASVAAGVLMYAVYSTRC